MPESESNTGPSLIFQQQRGLWPPIQTSIKRNNFEQLVVLEWEKDMFLFRSVTVSVIFLYSQDNVTQAKE